MSDTALLVKDFMTPNPVTVQATDVVEAAVKVMEENQVRGLPVLDEQGHVVGVLSEGDLLVRESPFKPPLYITFLGSIIYFESPTQFHQHFKKSLGMLVQDIMSTKPVVISPQATLADAANAMLQKHVTRLPVVDDSKGLVGILTRHDLIKALTPQVFDAAL